MTIASVSLEGDVDTLVSTRIKPETLGRWRSGGGQCSITLNLPGCWKEADEILERWRGYPAPDPAEAWFPCHDAILDAFCDSLASTYLIERICIERHNQRIRLKRDHCKPCCIEHLMIAMHNHVADCVTYHKREPVAQGAV